MTLACHELYGIAAANSWGIKVDNSRNRSMLLMPLQANLMLCMEVYATETGIRAEM